MKRILYGIILFFGLSISIFAQSYSLRVKEVDGTPNQPGVRTIIVSNGTLTCSGSTCTITTGGGGGGSPGTPTDSVQFNSSSTFAGNAGFTYTPAANPNVKITAAGNGFAGLKVINSATPTVPQVEFSNAAGTRRMQFAMAGNANVTDDFTHVSLYSAVAGTISMGMWNNVDGGEAAEFYMYAGTNGTDHLRLRMNDVGGGNTNFFEIPASGVFQTSNVSTGGMVLLANTTAPIIFVTGGSAFSNEKGRFDANGLTLGKASSITGALNLAHASSANLTTIKAGNAAAAVTYTLPTNVGAAGSVLTDSAGNGTLSWGSSFLGLASFTPPIDADFTWINQGGASVTSGTNFISLRVPTDAGNNARIRKKAAPSTPYTITVGFVPTMVTETGTGFNAGFVWRQSSDGKFSTAALVLATSVWYYTVSKWDAPGTFVGNYTVIPNTMVTSGMVWLRCSDNGTNRTVSVSSDGVNFTQIHTVGRTDFITANEVGFYMDAHATVQDGIMSIVSWKETSP